MKKQWSAVLIAGCCVALAPYAAAEEKPISPPLLAKWAGPYEDTVIYKLADYGEGVACYIYAPKTVSYSFSRDGALYGNNNIGSISCVKVVDSKPLAKK